MNQPCNETPRHRSIKTQSKTVRQENNKKLMPCPQEMSCCQAFLETAKFPNLTMLKNKKPVSVKLTIIIGQLVLLRHLKSRLWTASTKNGWLWTIISFRFFTFPGPKLETWVNLFCQSSRKTRVLNLKSWNKRRYQ